MSGASRPRSSESPPSRWTCAWLLRPRTRSSPWASSSRATCWRAERVASPANCTSSRNRMVGALRGSASIHEARAAASVISALDRSSRSGLTAVRRVRATSAVTVRSSSAAHSLAGLGARGEVQPAPQERDERRRRALVPDRVAAAVEIERGAAPVAQSVDELGDEARLAGATGPGQEHAEPAFAHVLPGLLEDRELLVAPGEGQSMGPGPCDRVAPGAGVVGDAGPPPRGALSLLEDRDHLDAEGLAAGVTWRRARTSASRRGETRG